MVGCREHRSHSSRPALLHESLFLGVAGELYAAVDAELLIDVVEMHLDRSLADEEFLADLHIAQPAAICSLSETCL